MSLSPEVQAAVDKIGRDRDLIASMRKADELRDKQLADLQAKINELSGGSHLSDEDRQALVDAVDEARNTHSELQAAVPANTDGAMTVGAQPAGYVPPTPLERDENATRADPLPGTGQNGTVPLMPNSAFDPDPTKARGVGDGGQPNQPAAIETAGGFVIAGGGSVARAPGSMPDSPSSSLVVPTDPDAKAPANNADLAKSGLSDSSQNALLGADGRPIADGPGIPGPVSEADAKLAQEQADKAAAEKAAREANPLNLAPAGTPQAGSVFLETFPPNSPGQRLDPDGKPPTGGTPDPTAPPAPGPNTGHDGDPNQRAPA